MSQNTARDEIFFHSRSKLRQYANLQNDHDELWNVLDYAVPGCLGDKNQFKEFYAMPMKRAQQASANAVAIDKVCRPAVGKFSNAI